MSETAQRTTSCRIKLYTVLTATHGNSTMLELQPVSELDILYVCFFVNVAIGASPLIIAWVVPNKHQLRRRLMKNMYIMCLVTLPVSLKIGPALVFYHFLQLTVLLLIATTVEGQWGQMDLHAVLLIAVCMGVGTAQAWVTIANNVYIVFAWWVLFALVLAERVSLRFRTLVIIGQIILIWTVAVNCWTSN